MPGNGDDTPLTFHSICHPRPSSPCTRSSSIQLAPTLWLHCPALSTAVHSISQNCTAIASGWCGTKPTAAPTIDPGTHWGPTLHCEALILGSAEPCAEDGAGGSELQERCLITWRASACADSHSLAHPRHARCSSGGGGRLKGAPRGTEPAEGTGHAACC